MGRNYQQAAGRAIQYSTVQYSTVLLLPEIPSDNLLLRFHFTNFTQSKGRSSLDWETESFI